MWRGGAQGSWEARGEKAREGAGCRAGRGRRVHQGEAGGEAPGGGGRRGAIRHWVETRGWAVGEKRGGTVGGCCDNEGSRIRETEGYVGRSGRSGRLPKVMPAGSAGGLAVDIHRKGGKEVNPFPVMDN